MNTLLVPTDFSAAADVAFNYALSLAKNMHARIVLLHAYQPAVPIAQVPFGVLNEERLAFKKEAEEKLKVLAERIERTAKLDYEYIAEEGEAVDTILRASREKAAAMIIMGATGATGALQVAFGSTSLRVMEKAACPVLTVPGNVAISKPIKRIVYATDYHRSDLAAISMATQIAGASNAQLNILHISDAVIGADEEKTLMKNFMKKVKELTLYPELSFEIIHGFNVEARLRQYLNDGGADMLMMSTHYRTFVDRLFGNSITNNLVKDTLVPVVAFHYNAETAVKLV